MLDVKENVSLAPYTVFKIGGPARFFAEVGSVEGLKEAAAFVKKNGLPVFILGEGSNVVISGRGFPGLVLRNRILGLEVESNGRQNCPCPPPLLGPKADFACRCERSLMIRAGGGENWDKFVELAVQNNAAGVECLSGIPGTVGAAPVQNIGAYGQSVGETIESVEAVDLETGREAVLNNQECGFGYRTSRFKKEPQRFFITSVNFRLKKGGAPALLYHDLKNYFGANPNPTLIEVRQAVLEIRSRKGMVLTGEELHTSVGSFFTNPIVGADLLEELKPKIEKCQQERKCCAPPWFWERPDGKVKVSAACLIECAGFRRGMRVGNVGISPLHSLALVNLGGASSSEVTGFAGEIQKRVKEKFGIHLEIEPQLVGF